MRLRRSLGVWAAASLIAFLVLFMATDWSSRFDPDWRCTTSGSIDSGVQLPNNGRPVSWDLATTAETQRIPPGVRCTEQVTGVSTGSRRDIGKTGSYDVHANAVDWLVLAGLSLAGGLALSAICLLIVGLAKRSGLWGWPPPRNPFVWIDRNQ